MKPFTVDSCEENTLDSRSESRELDCKSHNSSSQPVPTERLHPAEWHLQEIYLSIDDETGQNVSSKRDRPETRDKVGLCVAVGAGVGVARGVVMNELALWIAIGVAMGIALGAGWSRT